MILLSLTSVWLIQLASAILWFLMLVILASGLLRYFLPPYHPLLGSLSMLSAPLLRFPRRWLRPLARSLPFDLAPWLVLLALWLIQRGILEPLQYMCWRLNPVPFVPRATWADLLRLAVYAYMFVVLLRVLMSWFQAPRQHPFARWVDRLTDPALTWVRRLLSLRAGRVDLTPLVLVAALDFADRVLITALLQYTL